MLRPVAPIRSVAGGAGRYRRSIRRTALLPEFTDEELVEAARGGDRESLEILLRRHHHRLSALCRRLTGNRADGADATQDAMVRIVRSLPRFDGRSTFATWSHRVAVNVCIDELRRRRRRGITVAFDEAASGAASGQWAPGGLALGAPAGVGRAAPGDMDLSGGVADHLDVDRALSALSAEFRLPVVMRDLGGLSYAEIADVLDVPIGTVRSRIARGRAALVPALADPDEGRLSGPDSRDHKVSEVE